ncbi:bifunctional diguanylate cyclase/phosphodiesterase [Massilia sp. NP310]|uniref:putative bifunctional diguanylate cyclase/phosphodiesterase n=1 Tax=Massilia sp. NP310 TaxID=2861282 RepID=UPI001C629C65|nr:EAL domain-containing protein [Massilia sp. NP310]QYG03092.1 EAL domain-containing protein [Massilia sp. NP310]
MLIPQARVAPAANQEAPAVLLVNDDPGALFALRSVLGDLDADLVTASSGEQALLRLLKQDFCVILMDVKMAGLDGFETARLVRARPRSRATPIVFLTSHRASDLDRSRGFEVGASDYVFMPVAPEVLKAKVQAFLDDAPERRPVRALALGAHGEAPDAGIERLILEHAGDYVALLDPAGAWLYTSPSYRAEFGAAVGPGARYLEIVQVDDRERVRALVEHPPAGESHWRLQYRVLGRSERYFESDASLIRAPNGAVSQLVLISRDITERKEMEAYVLHQSFHDSLTGLPNRLLLLDRLGQATAQRERQRAQVAVLFLDLDHFKEVNDTLGHAAGDRLLQVVAERLAASVREGDTVARVGGDEFVVMLVELHQLADAALVAEKIISAVSEACQIEGSELHIVPSIGMAIFPGDGGDPDTLLRNADIAMYHAKRDGGAHYCFFTAQMQEVASHRLALGSALQRAIRNDEFVMHYQPKVRAASGAIIGFEALIRWPQADGATISPSQFIPIAEETGRIDPIGAWAIRQVAAELQRWTGLGFADVPIAVNVSALQFRREDVARSLGAAVDAARIQPALLEVELTESGVMSNPAQAIETLHQIHALGMTIAIDDFGTGYSSLAYLKRFPIDKLKIDASFVRDIATDPSDAAIVLAIIGLAHVLELTVIAEGVETREQVDFLVAHGCDELQGNYFSAAVSNEDAVGLLRRGPFRIEATREHHDNRAGGA